MATNSDLVGADYWPRHARFDVADATWTRVELPTVGDNVAFVGKGDLLVSFDQSLTDGVAVNTATDVYEEVNGVGGPSYDLGTTARAPYAFVAGDGAALKVTVTVTRAD